MWGLLAALVLAVQTVPVYEGTPMLALKTSQEGVWYVLGQEGTQVHQDALLLGDPTTHYLRLPVTHAPGHRDLLWRVLRSTGLRVAP